LVVANSHLGAKPAPELLAPRWHTALLVGLIIGVALVGTFLTHRGVRIDAPAGAGSRIVSMYLPLTAVAWGLLVYVCRIGRPRSILPLLLGELWTGIGRASSDLSIAFLVWAIIEASEIAWTRVFGPTSSSAQALLPQGITDLIAWVFVAASVGFCEEVVYRGYFQTQFKAFTHRSALAIVLQAALFGIAHAEQGAAAAARFTVYGCLLGALAHWRRSLLPGIVCHVGVDLASGLLAA